LTTSRAGEYSAKFTLLGIKATMLELWKSL
jgi:hypothetical protein